MPIKVVIAGRSSAAVQWLSMACAVNSELECRSRILSDGDTDALSDLDQDPDMVVLCADPARPEEIENWTARATDQRPPLIVIGPSDRIEVLKAVIRSGAKTFLTDPVKGWDLIASLKRANIR